MEKILISSCLLGESVRYDGGDKKVEHDILRRWIEEGRVVPVCPEVAGGLPVPRPPAEIVGGEDGARVIAGDALVRDSNGRDASGEFTAGAQIALATAKAAGIRVAILKEGSPSCGSAYVYDGTFSSTRVPNHGVAAALLRDHGIRVFSETRIADVDELLRELEG